MAKKKTKTRAERDLPRWRVADVECPSGKVPYLTYRDAEIALASAIMADRMEQRIYECDGKDGIEPCGHWHLTRR